MADEQKKLPARFYRNRHGKEPVREWLLALKDVKDRKIIGADIKTPRKRIARVLFCEVRGQMVLLHAFVKKTKTTPKKELDIARARQREVER